MRNHLPAVLAAAAAGLTLAGCDGPKPAGAQSSISPSSAAATIVPPDSSSAAASVSGTTASTQPLNCPAPSVQVCAPAVGAASHETARHLRVNGRHVGLAGGPSHRGWGRSSFGHSRHGRGGGAYGDYADYGQSSEYRRYREGGEQGSGQWSGHGEHFGAEGREDAEFRSHARITGGASYSEHSYESGSSAESHSGAWAAGEHRSHGFGASGAYAGSAYGYGEEHGESHSDGRRHGVHGRWSSAGVDQDGYLTWPGKVAYHPAQDEQDEDDGE